MSDKMREALEFYADPRRYQGPNQNPIPNDQFAKPDAVYIMDVSRDNGSIARAALQAPPSRPVSGEPSGPCCPFCRRDPFHRTDSGEAVAVTCCDLGNLYFRGARKEPEEVTIPWEDFCEIAVRLRGPTLPPHDGKVADLSDAPKDGVLQSFEVALKVRGYWDAELRNWILSRPIRMDFVPSPARYLGPAFPRAQCAPAKKVCLYSDGCPMDGPVCHLCTHVQPGGAK